MNKFIVGDRVRVYTTNVAKQPVELKGVVKSCDASSVWVRSDRYPELPFYRVHYKQCRLLKKTRQKIWIRDESVFINADIKPHEVFPLLLSHSEAPPLHGKWKRYVEDK